MARDPLVYIIAGEPSGDALGARLMTAMKEQAEGKVRFIGIGGERMQAEGLTSLFPMSEISLMGFLEIVPHIPQLLRRIKETVNDIFQRSPSVVITIDSPGFTFRVARKLKDSGIRCIHYVAPSVWAYKPERAVKVAELFDHILVLFPFEKQYFTEAGISSSFVGHPIIEQPAEPGDGAMFREKYGIPPDRKLLLMLPGSRKGELSRHLPLFRQTATRLKEHFPELECLLVTIPATHAAVQEQVKDWPVKTMVIGDAKERRHAYAAANAALVKSGTATLEVGLAGVPMVMTYKLNPISAWLIARMIKTPYFCLVNILARKEIVPELLQHHATPDRLSWELVSLMAPGGADAQLSAAKEALSKLYPPGGETPSQLAARVIWQRLGRRRIAAAA